MFEEMTVHKNSVCLALASCIVTVQTLKLEHLEEDCPISTFLKT